MSVAAASQLPEPLPAAAAPAATVEVDSDEVSPVPAPVLFLAGGLLAVAAIVRWRQKMAAKAE